MGDTIFVVWMVGGTAFRSMDDSVGGTAFGSLGDSVGGTAFGSLGNSVGGTAFESMGGSVGVNAHGREGDCYSGWLHSRGLGGGRTAHNSGRLRLCNFKGRPT